MSLQNLSRHFIGAASLFLLLPQVTARLRVSGSDLYDGSTRIKLKGIGVTCTEYMTKMGMDDAAKGEWPGHWAYKNCFGGPPIANADRVQLNMEPRNLLAYLLPDSHGGSFPTKPHIKKVKFDKPYDEVVQDSAPEARPVVRIPMCGSLYLYETSHIMYQVIIDGMVQTFTNLGIYVILDLHWNCPDSSEMQGCTGAQAASMALRKFGDKPGAVAFWDAVSLKYASNHMVLYELFNEPWIMEYKKWYGGDDTYAGMKDMYDAVRKNTADGIVIIGGKDQYALDAQSGLAFHLQYKEETGDFPKNILWNVHPYVGLGQGLEHSLLSALRITLALKTIGPVIFTEFGQYCCGGTGDPCSGSGSCADKKHGDYFVHNVINMAEQYDISWIGWAWRGAAVNNAHRPCLDGMAECNQPDMRDIDNATGKTVLTDGRHAGADWRTAWGTFVTPKNGQIVVQDAIPEGVKVGDAQPAGFLPRPCIAGQTNLGVICGWKGANHVASLSAKDFTSQSIFTSILPGLPGTCETQGCPGFTCDTYTGPCKGKGKGSKVTPPQAPQTTRPFIPAGPSSSSSSPSPSPGAGGQVGTTKQPVLGGYLPGADSDLLVPATVSSVPQLPLPIPAPSPVTVPPLTTSSPAVVSGQGYCCFAWPPTGDACCGCYPSSRTKPGEWCGASQDRCTSCSGGHAHFCPSGCANNAQAAIQGYENSSTGELVLEDTPQGDQPVSSVAALRVPALAVLAVGVSAAVAVAARVTGRLRSSQPLSRRLSSYAPMPPQASEPRDPGVNPPCSA